MTTLDTRLTASGLAITVSTLMEIFADHFRGEPAKMTCPGCGYRFHGNNTSGDCPTNTVVRHLLRQRESENRKAVAKLSPAAFKNLRKVTPQPVRANKPAPVPVTGDLFDVTPYRRTGGTR